MGYQQTEINGYQVSIFNTNHGTELYISKDGVQLYGHKVSGDPMEKARELVAQFAPAARYDHAKLLEAKTQLVGYFVTFHAQDMGARWFSALEKAHTEVLENDSIKFDGTRLIFTSRASGKQRIVTRYGCTKECECGGLISYHHCLFLLLSRYDKLINNVRQFPTRVAQPSYAEVAA